MHKLVGMSCSAGYATLLSRLCYPVQQTILPCSAGYATCSVGYATLWSMLCYLFSRLSYPVQPAMPSKVENIVKYIQLSSGLDSAWQKLPLRRFVLHLLWSICLKSCKFHVWNFLNNLFRCMSISSNHFITHLLTQSVSQSVSHHQTPNRYLAYLNIIKAFSVTH